MDNDYTTRSNGASPFVYEPEGSPFSGASTATTFQMTDGSPFSGGGVTPGSNMSTAASMRSVPASMISLPVPESYGSYGNPILCKLNDERAAEDTCACSTPDDVYAPKDELYYQARWQMCNPASPGFDADGCAALQECSIPTIRPNTR